MLKVWDALKAMRQQDEGQKELIDSLVNKSADIFLYMLRRKAADVMSRGEIEGSEAVPYMIRHLDACGWRPSDSFVDSLHDVFDGSTPGQNKQEPDA